MDSPDLEITSQGQIVHAYNATLYVVGHSKLSFKTLKMISLPELDSDLSSPPHRKRRFDSHGNGANRDHATNAERDVRTSLA